MKRLIYSSIASEMVDFDVVGKILTHAVKKNKEKEITGMLVFDGNHFIQCIEGDETVIDELYQKLLEDSRHHSLHINGEEQDDKRLFTNWNMGYMNQASEIKKMIRAVTGSDDLSYEACRYSHAKLILLQLSWML